jgi:hypothetical protein
LQRLRTVLLRHTRRGDTHHDWIFETPGPDAGRNALTTFRVASPWAQWSAQRRLRIELLPPHRRAYLTRQGAVSGHRGLVTRVASGRLDVLAWHLGGGVFMLQPDDPSSPSVQLTLQLAGAASALSQVLVLPPPIRNG